jgi:hypothetical protein
MIAAPTTEAYTGKNSTSILRVAAVPMTGEHSTHTVRHYLRGGSGQQLIQHTLRSPGGCLTLVQNTTVSTVHFGLLWISRCADLRQILGH